MATLSSHTLSPPPRATLSLEYVSSVFPGNATGTIALDSSCDRTPDYYFFKMDVDGPFDIIGTTSRTFANGHVTIVSGA